jgi:hypothetical protein|tara:strand:+ start:1047 stop:1244 length:198 start_codon:yes stop_codon:yes gene_type:complete
MKEKIQDEINNHINDMNYWGTKKNIENESLIFDYMLDNKIVNQDWFDSRLKHTNIELLKELKKLL